MRSSSSPGPQGRLHPDADRDGGLLPDRLLAVRSPSRNWRGVTVGRRVTPRPRAHPGGPVAGTPEGPTREANRGQPRARTQPPEGLPGRRPRGHGHRLRQHRDLARGVGLPGDGGDGGRGVDASRCPACGHGRRRSGDGAPEELGRVSAGALADLLVLDANPRLGTRNLARIHRLVRNGKIVDRARSCRTPRRSSRSANSTLTTSGTWRPSWLRTPPTSRSWRWMAGRLKGLDAMRKRYADVFQKSPGLHCELVSRMAVGSFVVDEERVTAWATTSSARRHLRDPGRADREGQVPEVGAGDDANPIG